MCVCVLLERTRIPGTLHDQKDTHTSTNDTNKRVLERRWLDCWQCDGISEPNQGTRDEAISLADYLKTEIKRNLCLREKRKRETGEGEMHHTVHKH